MATAVEITNDPIPKLESWKITSQTTEDHLTLPESSRKSKYLLSIITIYWFAVVLSFWAFVVQASLIRQQSTDPSAGSEYRVNPSLSIISTISYSFNFLMLVVLGLIAPKRSHLVGLYESLVLYKHFTFLAFIVWSISFMLQCWITETFFHQGVPSMESGETSLYIVSWIAILCVGIFLSFYFSDFYRSLFSVYLRVHNLSSKIVLQTDINDIKLILRLEDNQGFVLCWKNSSYSFETREGKRHSIASLISMDTGEILVLGSHLAKFFQEEVIQVSEFANSILFRIVCEQTCSYQSRIAPLQLNIRYSRMEGKDGFIIERAL